MDWYAFDLWSLPVRQLLLVAILLLILYRRWQRAAQAAALAKRLSRAQHGAGPAERAVGVVQKLAETCTDTAEPGDAAKTHDEEVALEGGAEGVLDDKHSPAGFPGGLRELSYPITIMSAACCLLPPRPSVNSHIPFEVENEHFKGVALIKVRSTPMDPMYAPYFRANIKTLMEVQVQGSFKVLPRGTVFMGIEVPKRLGLSSLTKGLMGMMLPVVRRLVPDVHTSFGENPREEKAHAVFPIHKAADTFHISKPGEEPPSLGVDTLPGALDKTREREVPKYSLGHVYTISFYSKNLDIVGWKVKNMPGGQKIDLTSVLKSQPLNFVAYDLAGEDETHAVHAVGDKRYFFNIGVRSTGKKSKVKWKKVSKDKKAGGTEAKQKEDASPSASAPAAEESNAEPNSAPAAEKEEGSSAPAEEKDPAAEEENE